MRAVVVISLAAAIVLAAGYAVGGQAGLFALVALAAVAGLLAVRLRMPRPAPRPARPWARDPDPAFEGYRRIETAVSLAQASQRFFDHGARPLLQRLLAVLLADRRRLDIGKDTGAARAAVGDDLWPLLDPERPASDDSRRPGVSEQTLARIVDRLEDL